MPKITFTVPELGGDRKFFVKLGELEGLHGFRGPAHWRNKFTDLGHTHALRVRLDDRGVLELLAFPYHAHKDREYVDVDFKKPLTVIFKSITYSEEECVNPLMVNIADNCN